MKNRFVLFLSFSIGALLLLAILLFGLTQTNWFQKNLADTLQAEAKKEGINLYIEKMEAVAPFKWSIQKVSFSVEKDTFEMDNIKLKISPLSLIRKKLTLRFFSAKEIKITFTPSSNSSQIAFKKLPFDLNAKKISCEKIFLKNLTTEKTLLISFTGRAKIDREFKEINVQAILEEIETLNHLELMVYSSFAKKNLTASIDIKLTDTNNLSLFLSAPFIPSLEFTCNAQGKNSDPFSFDMQSEVTSLNSNKFPTLTSPLSLKSEGTFFLDPKSPYSLIFQTCQIQNDDLEISGSFTLTRDLKPLLGDLSISIKESSNLHTLFPFHGALDAKIHLDKNSFLSTIYSPSLILGNETYEPANFQVSAKKEKTEWKGSSLVRLEHPELPWKLSSLFILKEKELDFLDLSLCLADAKIGGSGAFFFKDTSYRGSFFVMAEELRPFRRLLPESEIDGKLGGSFALQGNTKNLSLDLSCLLKNIRYQNSLIDSVRIEAQINNLLTSPSGTLTCDAKNIFFRDMILSNVSFLSEPSSQELQTFSLQIDGDWKQELHFQSSGLWKKEGPFWEIEMNSCKGSVLSESFSLENPFAIKNTQKGFTLGSCLWKVGEGDVSGELSLSKELLEFKGESHHLPLGILGVLYPKMAFQGTASFQSSISGPPDALKGHFFATLEKADFSQNSAKGSLQIHFNPSGAQIHSHLYATKNQFLDWTATLPLNYSFAPFSWEIDPLRPITSELTMQGAVENIFDFVNTASHKSSGWITAHLFLSGNLKQPSVLGSLKCEQGSYENYFTGTHLKNMEVEIAASNHTLTLTSFTGSDEKEGILTAEGSLNVSPEKNFPFELKTDLKNMHVVHSDFIDASLSGSLSIKGDELAAHASGNLTADQALFKIVDELLYEIPTLPVTYINKPIHLQTSSLQNAPPYPLYIDVELTAEDSVVVQGRGLDSNWHGNIQLTGTVANPAAKGSLTLNKGEFVFSGKTFTLMQGEISFYDKPSPGAYLKINGELSLPSATILAQMQGPLTSPQLTFQSIPSLPTSSILALILFDKDISEISALQALQLAQTIVSLSGNGGPGVLDSIRKKIGVDRLNIVGKDGTDEISVQIGWYLNHGITISLSQSATSSDVTVEVDLKNGFIFQAETQNQEEGKFSLKWNRNY